MKTIEMCLVVIILVALAFVTCGCEEVQQTKQYGRGDPPAGWQDMFGNDNLARLNFAQSQAVDRQATIIYGINAKDPNGQIVRKRGLIERVTTLESLEERVRKLEDPNNCDLMTVARLSQRVKKLEEAQPEVVAEIPKTGDTLTESLIRHSQGP